MTRSFDILNSLPDSIAIINPNGDIIFTNNAWNAFAQENSGIPEKTGVGVNYFEACFGPGNIHQLQNAEVTDGIKLVIAGIKEQFEFEYPCHSETEHRWFIMRCTPLTDGSDSIIISHINITLRKLAEQKIEEQREQQYRINQRLSTSLHKIVHDIQAPLSSMLGLINLSKLEHASQTTDEYLTLIEKSVTNLRAYIADTLKLSATASNFQETHFKALINDVYQSLRFDGKNENLKFEIDVAQHSEFYTYKTELISVVSNLISNSMKYCDPQKSDPCVVINAHVTETEASISVADNGIGMAPETIDKLFTKFFRAEKNMSGGFGVGLYLVKNAVELMNGKIEVTSELGKGTKFTVVLPNLQKRNLQITE